MVCGEKLKMKLPSIKRNYVLNTLNTLLSPLFSLISIGYASRILSLEGVGKVNLAQAYTVYFSMIGALGISFYGTRQISKIRHDKEVLSRNFWELFLFNLATSTLAFLLFLLFFLFDPKVQSEKLLYLITGSMLFLGVFSVDWFYSGIENYSYITARSIIVKIVCLAALFIFVRHKNDYIIYGSIGVIAAAGSYIFNIWNVRRYVNFDLKIFKTFRPFRHFLPIIIVFGMNAANTIYYNLNTVMLGYMADYKAVGLYSQTFKIIAFILPVLTSLGLVLMPRSSLYIETGNKIEYHRILKKAVDFYSLLAIPAAVGLLILSESFVHIFLGAQYSQAVPALRIFSINLPIVTTTSILGYQILYPNNMEKKMAVAFIIASVVNIVLNIFLLPKFTFIGGSISYTAAEIVVMISMLFFCMKLKLPRLLNINNLYHLIGAGIMGIVLYLMNNIINTSLFNFLNIISYIHGLGSGKAAGYIISLFTFAIKVLSGLVIYFGFLLIVHDKITIDIKNIIFRRLKIIKS